MEKKLISIFAPGTVVSSPVCLYDGNFKGKATEMLKIKYKRSIFRCFPFENIISVNLNGRFDVCFAVNKADTVCGIDIPYKTDMSHSVYVGIIDQPTLNLALEKVKRQIESLLLTDQESLFVLRNGMFLNVANCDNIRERFDLLLDIRHKILGKKEVAEINFPPEFKKLEPLARKWAASDDVKRQDISESMSDRERDTFLKTMTPYVERINDYLKHQIIESQVSEDATILERLAELYAEMQQ